jgi:hypothetical protein
MAGGLVGGMGGSLVGGAFADALGREQKPNDPFGLVPPGSAQSGKPAWGVYSGDPTVLDY